MIMLTEEFFAFGLLNSRLEEIPTFTLCGIAIAVTETLFHLNWTSVIARREGE